MTAPVVIYTDGACKGNPGPGGWGALLQYDGEERELFGGETHTTMPFLPSAVCEGDWATPRVE